MNHLLVFTEDDTCFDTDRLRLVLETLGCTDIRQGQFIGSVLDCEFSYADQSAIIRLSDDMKTITMSNTGDATLKAVLAIQQQLDRSLRMVDMSYSFDIVIEQETSLDDLRRQTSGDARLG